MLSFRTFFKVSAVCLFIIFSSHARTGYSQDFDFDNGNSAIEIIIPSLIPVIFQDVSPTGGDATLVLRATAVMTNAWFDAIAPYHPTAVGVYSNLGRRPAEEGATNRNKNIAMFYATYHVLNSLLPQHQKRWQDLLASVGLDANNTSEDLTTAVGIGNVAGKKVVAFREQDGMNQLGDLASPADGRGKHHRWHPHDNDPIARKYHRMPYADYTAYRPVNTAYTLRDPGRWQPNMTSRNGIFKIQQYVTPQLGLTKAYSYSDPDDFSVAPPYASNPKNRTAYKDQADEVLEVSANLTDEQKMMAELFDNKINSLGFSALFITQTRGLSLDEFVHYDFMTNLAAFDGAIAIWRSKYRYDAVRPFSAIRYLYGDDKVTAWGGPGLGTVDDISGSEWKSYLDPADHPEYPSASACFCAAHAQSSRRYLGSDQFGWRVDYARGSSRIEPGVTPASDISISWPTWTDFENQCGQSRLWGGVHFSAAIEASQPVCHRIGDRAYEFVQHHISGNVN